MGKYPSTADDFARALGNDGQCFERTDPLNGTTIIFEEVAELLGATVEYGVRQYDDSEPGDARLYYAAGYSAAHIADDPVRYVFPDGSAVVAIGTAWDLEGDEPFSWSQ